jgi:hypothetical protein
MVVTGRPAFLRAFDMALPKPPVEPMINVRFRMIEGLLAVRHGRLRRSI